MVGLYPLLRGLKPNSRCCHQVTGRQGKRCLPVELSSSILRSRTGAEPCRAPNAAKLGCPKTWCRFPPIPWKCLRGLVRSYCQEMLASDLAFLLCLDRFNPNPPRVRFATQLHIHFTTGGDRGRWGRDKAGHHFCVSGDALKGNLWPEPRSWSLLQHLSFTTGEPGGRSGFCSFSRSCRI